MKETNMEHYRGEIEEIISNKCTFGVSNKDGKIHHCHVVGCSNCAFIGKGISCEVGMVQWLMSEHKPEPVLTEREKHFVECIEDGYIARDENYHCLNWYSKDVKPRKITFGWTGDKTTKRVILSPNAMLNFDMFPFITWEDKEPWSVEELRKLKVEE